MKGGTEMDEKREVRSKTEGTGAYMHPDFEKWIGEAEEVAEFLHNEGNLRWAEGSVEVMIDDAVCRWYETCRHKESLRSFLCRSLAEEYYALDDCDGQICVGEV